MTSEGEVTVEVRRAEPEDELRLRSFFAEVWGGEESDAEGGGGDSPPEGGGAGGGAGPERPPSFIFVRDGAVVGYLGTLPTTFVLDGGRAEPGHWLKGFWVLPEHRNGPVGFALARQAAKELEVVGASLVAVPARRLFEAVGLTEIGLLFNRVRVLRPSRVLAGVRVNRLDLGPDRKWLGRALRVLQRTRLTGIAGAVVRVLLGGWVGLRRRADPSVRTRRGWEHVTGEALNRVWARTKTRIDAAPSRDGRSVFRRYGDDEPYRMVSAWSGSDCTGWAVLKDPSPDPDPRLQGVRVACLSDILFDPARVEVGAALLRELDELASTMDVDAIVCSGTHPALGEALSRSGYLRFPGNLHFMFRGPGTGDSPRELERWWLTRGDGRSDDVF